MIGIYKITNLINGKVYIGQSTNVKQRFTRHRNTAANPKYKHYNYPLYCAIRKYGIENFSFEVIEECKACELNEKEIFYISQYKSTNRKFGYNQDVGGKNTKHGKLSEQQLVNIKNDLKNSKLSATELAQKYNVHFNTILSINTGATWYDENETYPIRKQYTCGKVTRYNKPTYHCSICGKEIKSKSAKYCPQCVHFIQQRVDRPDAMTLAKMIKDFGYEETGRKFGVTGNTIKSWIVSYGLPPAKKDLIKWLNNNLGIKEILPEVKPPKIIRAVYQKDSKTKAILNKFNSAKLAAQSIGIKRHDHIVEACDGRRQGAYGFCWEYAD